MQSRHLVFLIAVVVYPEEPPLVPEKLVSFSLFLDVVDEELNEHAFLALVDDGVGQFREIRGERVSGYQDVSFRFLDHRLDNGHCRLRINSE